MVGLSKPGGKKGLGYFYDQIDMTGPKKNHTFPREGKVGGECDKKIKRKALEIVFQCLYSGGRSRGKKKRREGKRGEKKREGQLSTINKPEQKRQKQSVNTTRSTQGKKKGEGKKVKKGGKKETKSRRGKSRALSLPGAKKSKDQKLWRA